MNKFLILGGLFFTFLTASAQQVGVNTETPDPSAVLDITSTDGGLLIPRLTTTQRLAISTPAAGLMVYDNDFEAFFFYSASGWNSFDTSGVWISNGTDIYNGNTGNVGIGTTTPQSDLHVATDTGDVEIRLSGGSASDFIVSIDESEGIMLIGSGTDAASMEAMVVDTMGYVGIGNRDPQSSLHIGNDSSAANITIESGYPDVTYVMGVNPTDSAFRLTKESVVDGTTSLLEVDEAGNVHIDRDGAAALYVQGVEYGLSVNMADGVADLYNATAQTINPTWTDFTWDVERHLGADFTHAGGSAELQINETALYQITYTSSIYDFSGEWSPSHFRILHDSGSGFNPVPGSDMYQTYANYVSIMTTTRTVYLSLTTGDKIKIQGTTGYDPATGLDDDTGGLFVETVPGGCSLSLMRMQSFGF